jgi:flagellar assembly protein FliH
LTATSFDFGQLARPEPLAPAGSPADVAHLVEAARAEGHAAGRQEGSAEAMALVADSQTALHGAAQALLAERDAQADATERAAVELALRLTHKIVGAAVEADPALVVEAVRGALRLLLDRERFTVLVNPADLEIVREGLAAVIAELGGVEHFEVQGERRVARGGAVVRTAEGEVDASLDAKLQRAREVLEDELAGR